jgi:hypothetical protein
VSVSVALPAVVARSGGRPAVDCRTVPVCTVVAFPYRSTEVALAPVSFAPSGTPAARPPTAVRATPRFTG